MLVPANLNYFYFDDPSPEKLGSFNEYIAEYLGLGENHNSIWFNTQYRDLTEATIADNLKLIPDTVGKTIVLWSPGSHLVPNAHIIGALNEFAESRKEPVVWFSGALGPWAQSLTNLKFTLSQVCYFEHESRATWEGKLEIGDPAPRDMKFLMMGTKDYPNRKYLLSEILINDLHHSGYVSYKQLDHRPLPVNFYSPAEKSMIEQLARRADPFLPRPALDDSIEYGLMPQEFLRNSYVNIITDTFFETVQGSTFISEKVFNAIAHQQLFIMMSPPGTLEYLRGQGYQTFGDVIDESYDSVENNYQRLVAVTKSALSLLNKSPGEIWSIYQQCWPKLQHNYRNFMNNRVSEQVNSVLSLVTSDK